MIKDFVITITITVVTLLVSLGIIRYQAPHLLGIPNDLQMVRVSEEMPPFFESVFPENNPQSSGFTLSEFIIKDPYTGVRAQPLYSDVGGMGPNDILGFRNKSVPNVADIIVIGDSQTYGNNSRIDRNWPNRMTDALNKNQMTMAYNMSVGGWGGVQYLYAATHATVFQPKVLVIAFYTGNDSLESFRLAYNYDLWEELIPDTTVSASNVPELAISSDDSNIWPVRFSDGIRTIFTPKTRYVSNQDHPAVKAGYDIVADVAGRIVSIAHPRNIQVVFTIIPTKELVYEKKINAEHIEPTATYNLLVSAEKANIERLSDRIRNIENAIYVDLVDALQDAAMEATKLYDFSADGHPVDAGYQAIADIITPVVESVIPERIQGFVMLETGEGRPSPLWVHQDRYWDFAEDIDSVTIDKSGWEVDKAATINVRELAGLKLSGTVTVAQLEEHGAQGLGGALSGSVDKIP